MTILQVVDLTRRFGGLVAVDHVNNTVRKGEVRGLIGPNGAGKTTLLNLIGGQIRPSGGQIVFQNKPVMNTRVDRLAALGIRRTFQNLKLFLDMTVIENVMIGLHADTRAEVVAALLHTPNQRREETWVADQSYEALKTVGLEESASLCASSLSYGHRRLLEIARAIVCKPHLLLLDEPAAGLNPTESLSLVSLIRRINATGITIILVEHDMDVVMTACTKISVLNYGKLLAEGSPEEIRSHPAVIEAYLGRGDLSGGA
jgi:branched-chain amino acid transport system ATP-binding protein